MPQSCSLLNLGCYLGKKNSLGPRRLSQYFTFTSLSAQPLEILPVADSSNQRFPACDSWKNNEFYSLGSHYKKHPSLQIQLVLTGFTRDTPDSGFCWFCFVFQTTTTNSTVFSHGDQVQTQNPSNTLKAPSNVSPLEMITLNTFKDYWSSFFDDALYWNSSPLLLYNQHYILSFLSAVKLWKQVSIHLKFSSYQSFFFNPLSLFVAK